jgi:hypothetical protein
VLRSTSSGLRSEHFTSLPHITVFSYVPVRLHLAIRLNSCRNAPRLAVPRVQLCTFDRSARASVAPGAHSHPYPQTHSSLPTTLSPAANVDAYPALARSSQSARHPHPAAPRVLRGPLQRARHHLDNAARVETRARPGPCLRVDLYVQGVHHALVASHLEAGLPQGHHPHLVPGLQEPPLDQRPSQGTWDDTMLGSR